MKKVAIAFDIGGTKTRVALVDENLKILTKYETSTPGDKKTALKVLENYLDFIKLDLPKNTSLAGVGVSIAGVPVNGKLTLSPNTPFDGISLAELKKVLGAKTKIENDMNCAAIAESHVGAGKNIKNFIAMTISTGIGSGIFIDGKLYKGTGKAGAVGHIVISTDTESGLYESKDGNFEYLGSGRGLTRIYQRYTGLSMSPRPIQDRAEKKDRIALAAFEESATYIGYGLASVVNLLDPEVIILSGSHILNGWNLLEPTIKKVLKQSAVAAPKLVKSPLKGDSPLLGAASLVFSPR